jgi:hypothetical protein
MSQDAQEIDDPLLACERIRQRKVSFDRVLVASTASSTCDVSRALELSDDSVRRPFGDPHVRSDLTQPNTRVVRDTEQDLRMVGQERPLRCVPR